MFEPTDDETAMSPLPCLATKTLVIKSEKSHISWHGCDENSSMGLDLIKDKDLNGNLSSAK